MPVFFRQLLEGLAETWRRLSLSARVQLALAGLLTLGLMSAVVFFGGKAQYVQLYAGLDLDESSQMTSWLTDNDIPFQQLSGGTEIKVPVQHVSRAKTGLAGQGLPTFYNDPGFELFDNVDLMTNQFQMGINRMRATQGRLQHHLRQFDYIKNAVVFIHEEPESLFYAEQEPSKASVTLDTVGDLTKMQVESVLHVVTAYGGANLSPNNIAISRARDGKIYHKPVEEGFIALAADKLEYQAALEFQRQKKLEGLFRGVEPNARFTVSANIDWTSESIVNHDVHNKDPKKPVKVSSEISLLETSTTVGPPEGPAGAIANIPQDLGEPGQEVTSTTEETSLDNFEPSVTVTNTQKDPGVVTQFRVAAFIEGGYGEAGEDGQRGEYIALTPEERTNYENMIIAAVSEGTLPTVVEIFDSPLGTLELEQAPIVAATPFWQSSNVVRLVMNALLLGLAFILVLVFSRRLATLPVEEEEAVEIPEASPEEQRRQEIMAEVERLSQEDPATVAALLRSWMAEEQQ